MKERRSYDAERNLKLVTTPLVCLSDVSKQFDRIRALDHVSLAIPEGRIIGLLGPNGSGKTTMLKILAGLYTEYEGSVSIDGMRPGAKTKACVAYLPDSSCLPEKMLVSDIVRLYEIFFADFDAEKCRKQPRAHCRRSKHLRACMHGFCGNVTPAVSRSRGCGRSCLPAYSWYKIFRLF